MMELETSLDQPDEKEPAIPLPFPKAWWWRAVYGIYIVALTAVAFSAIDAFETLGMVCGDCFKVHRS